MNFFDEIYEICNLDKNKTFMVYRAQEKIDNSLTHGPIMKFQILKFSDNSIMH